MHDAFRSDRAWRYGVPLPRGPELALAKATLTRLGSLPTKVKNSRRLASTRDECLLGRPPSVLLALRARSRGTHEVGDCNGPRRKVDTSTQTEKRKRST